MSKIPKPFEAPSIALYAHGKEWREVYPSELEVGDHVMNFGIIAEIRTDNGLQFVFAGTVEPITLAPDFTIQAFTRAA